MAANKGLMLDDYKEPVALPASFFSRLLPLIDDLAELKLTIYCLSAIQQKEGKRRYLRLAELESDARLATALSHSGERAHDVLRQPLGRAVARGALLEAVIQTGAGSERLYLLNDARGQSLYQQIKNGEWRPSAADDIEILPPRPSIYGLYEENIGVLTPMIVDSLKDAEATYPQDWIEEAMRLAVESNKRNWRYIRAILERWQQEGRNGEKSGRRLGRRKPARSRQRTANTPIARR